MDMQKPAQFAAKFQVQREHTAHWRCRTPISKERKQADNEFLNFGDATLPKPDGQGRWTILKPRSSHEIPSEEAQ
jgi:hypothetical protein